ncbi:hypothetical protein ACIRSU_25655 [Streptomyces sp. NPDC101160]|uniref:hypothetical protein n=1 Tax=Streptomyces sp. NPDC101160 TaxID=3366118 RepID=UPI0038267945
MISYQCDDDTLREYADKLLERPTNFGGDDRYYRTHAPVIGKADHADDLMAESNYDSALNLLRAAADEGRNDTEVSDEHVIDAGIRHWGWGPCSQVFVQVYADDVMLCRKCDSIADWAVSRKRHGRRRFLCTGCKSDWDWDNEHYGRPSLTPIKYRPKFTAAWREACSIISALEVYPILDESDYSDREWERWQSNVNEALAQAQREYGEDSEQQSAEIAESCQDEINELMGHEPDGGVSWQRVEDIYRQAREDYFTRLGNEHLNAPIAGQLALI